MFNKFQPSEVKDNDLPIIFFKTGSFVKYLPKNIAKPNKTLIISILDPIAPGMNSDEFLNTLQKNIYKEIDNII